MTRYFLSRIKIEGFRGINNESDPLELRFRPDAVNSVFSINGVGKSSIFEALNYAIRGTVPKLEELQAQENPGDYFCNRFHSQGTATIEVELKSDDGTSPSVTVKVQRDRNGNRTVTSPSGYADPEALLESLNEDFTLLDYRTFGRFIDSSPLERGRSFSALLGLSSYSDFRQTLQSICDTRALNSDLDITTIRAEAKSAEEAAQAALRRLKVSYDGLIGKDLTDVSQVDQCSTEVLSALSSIELIKGSVEGKTLDQIDFDAVKKAIKSAEGGEKRKELEKVIEKIAEIEGLGEADVSSLATEQTEISRLLKEKADLLEATRGDVFKQLYNVAKVLIEGGDWKEPKKCPLCESDLKVAIGDLVKNQLDQYSQVSAKAEQVNSAWSSAAWVRRLRVLEQAKALEVTDETKVSIPLAQKAVSGELTLAEAESAITALARLERKRVEALSSAKTRKGELEKELPPSLVSLTEQVEYGRQFREALEEYREKTAQKKTAESQLHVRERWKQFIGKATAVFAAAEVNLSRRRIAAIDSEYKSMFSRIMAVNDVVPELQRADRREDLHVQLSDFHGQSGVSARALLSESYRNALAISVFLSAALKQSGAPRFIVLDDVTSSFDSGHQWNLMEVVRRSLQYPKNANGLQFIILSHDGLLEKYFDKLGNTSDWHHQKLQGWPPMGAVMSQTQDANRLCVTASRLLDAGQVKEAEPLIRQYLEFKLLQIINKVRIPVPFDFAIKDHMKMVSNCLAAINAAIDLNKKAGTLVLDARQVSGIDTVHVPALVGNWVNHYETASGSSLSPPVLKGVLKTIDEIAECFRFDDSSSGTVQRRWYKSLSSKT